MEATRIQQYFLFLLLLGGLVLMFFILKPFMGALALALIFSVVLYPVYQLVLYRTGNRPGIAALVTTLGGIIFILIPFLLIGTQVLRQATELYHALSTRTPGEGAFTALLTLITDFVERMFPALGEITTNFLAGIDTYTGEVLQWMVAHLGTVFSSLAAFALGLFIFVIASYYLLRDGKELRHKLIKLSPFEDKDDEMIARRLALAVNSVVKGNLALAVIQGVLTAIGFTIFGIPNSILWGAVAAIGALIPGIGTALVIIPGILYLIFTEHMGAAIGLTVWGVFAVGLIDNFLGPKLVGSGMKLHPLLVLLSVLGGLAFFGPLGIFLGPLMLSFIFAILDIYSTYYKRHS